MPAEVLREAVQTVSLSLERHGLQYKKHTHPRRVTTKIRRAGRCYEVCVDVVGEKNRDVVEVYVFWPSTGRQGDRVCDYVKHVNKEISATGDLHFGMGFFANHMKVHLQSRHNIVATFTVDTAWDIISEAVQLASQYCQELAKLTS